MSWWEGTLFPNRLIPQIQNSVTCVKFESNSNKLQGLKEAMCGNTWPLVGACSTALESLFSTIPLLPGHT